MNQNRNHPSASGKYHSAKALAIGVPVVWLAAVGPQYLPQAFIDRWIMPYVGLSLLLSGGYLFGLLILSLVGKASD